MRTLPRHKIEKPIQAPLLFTGLSWCELAGWHRYYRLKGDFDRCREIEEAVSELSESDKYWIKKLGFYQPIK